MELKFERFILLLCMTFFIHTVKSEDNQYFVETQYPECMTEQDKIVSSFCAPLKFTRSGIRCFLKHTFSRKEYAEEFLPHNFSHFIEFLQFGKDSHQNNLYVQSTIRLFGNKVKSCKYINASAFETLLEKLPLVTDTYIVKKQTSLLTDVKNSIKRILYNLFLSKFSFFKQDPDGFFDEVSASIIESLHSTEYIQLIIDREQLRHNLLRFLDVTLNKVMWTPLDQEQVWISVKNISLKLEQIAQTDVITQDELDDLFQSLLERFIYFLDIAGSELSPSVIQEIKKDIDAKELLLLTFEEQEEFIEPKAERLKEALGLTEAKILAQHAGIITEPLPI